MWSRCLSCMIGLKFPKASPLKMKNFKTVQIFSLTSSEIDKSLVMRYILSAKMFNSFLKANSV